MRRILAAAVAVAFAFSAVPGFAQEKLTVWWVKGFYKSEDDALYAAIKAYEAKNPGVKIELSQYAAQDMIPKSVAALDAGTPPDIAYSDTYDVQVAGKWAFDGKLDDISDVITTMEAALLLVGIPVLLWTLIPLYHMFLFAISPKDAAFSGRDHQRIKHLLPEVIEEMVLLADHHLEIAQGRIGRPVPPPSRCSWRRPRPSRSAGCGSKVAAW